MKPILIVDRFSKNASRLRSHFEDRLGDPHSADNSRFVWDYWYVKDQYILHRTPAYHFFPEKTYLSFHNELITWGRSQLGCWDISPPWLSYYVSGCRQELHADVPHGPWAFVMSLTTNYNSAFTGGETLLLKPEVLTYWKGFGSQTNRERDSFIDLIEPKMNRLIVFDPRLPHGVREVRGTQDPLEGRLVIHGWFTEPKTYIDGYLPGKICEKILNEAFLQVQDTLSQEPLFSGTVSIQVSVSPSGRIQSLRFATNTLITTDGEIPANFNKKLLQIYRILNFPRAKGPTKMTIPLVFQ
jgi:hypothetical protein